MIIGNVNALYLLILLPLVILLHILLRRMESHTVSSLFIWELVKKKRRYRFPSILLLLLQLLVISLSALSLADIKIPFTIPLRKENSLLIIDNSASMNVVEGGKSRLDDAKEKAINVIKGSSGEIMLVTSSRPPRIINSYTNNRDVLIKAVKSIDSTELSNGVEEVMKIARASVTPEGSIIMISDGAFDYIPSETDNFKFIRAGKEKNDNMGISDFYLREKSSGDSYELYMTITNFSSEVKDLILQIFKGEELLEEISDSLESGELKKLIFDIESDSEKEIRARLITDDLLATDNAASSYISSNDQKRILLITPGNYFLEKVLQSIPGVLIETYTGMLENDDITQAETKPFLYSSTGIPVQKIPDNYDVVIYDRIPPLQRDKTGRFIFIDVIPSGLRSEQDKIRPQTISMNKEHPLLESVDFTKVTILKVWPPLKGPRIQELVSGGNAGLLYVMESQYLKFIYLPFDLTDSDLPLRASFPILMKNSINWLTDAYSREEIIQHKTGDSILIGIADPSFEKSYISDPSGRKMTVAGNLFDQTFYTGLYRFEYADKIYFGSVNLNNRDESDISSRFPEVTDEDREEKTGEYKFPMTTLLLLFLLFAILSEWLVQEEKW